MGQSMEYLRIVPSWMIMRGTGLAESWADTIRAIGSVPKRFDVLNQIATGRALMISNWANTWCAYAVFHTAVERGWDEITMYCKSEPDEYQREFIKNLTRMHRMRVIHLYYPNAVPFIKEEIKLR